MRKQSYLLFLLALPALLFKPLAAPAAPEQRAQTHNTQTHNTQRYDIQVPITEVSIQHLDFFRTSPVYQATLRRDGTATYVGVGSVNKIGTYTASITGFDRLTRAIQKRGVEHLQDEYRDNAVDLPTTTTTVVWKRRRKVIRSYENCAPQALKETQALIEAMVAEAHWKKVSSSTDFH